MTKHRLNLLFASNHSRLKRTHRIRSTIKRAAYRAADVFEPLKYAQERYSWMVRTACCANVSREGRITAYREINENWRTRTTFAITIIELR